MHYTITVRPADEGFRALCPQLPGISGQGATAGQALDAAVAALTKRLVSRGESPPTIHVVHVTLDQASAHT